MKKNRTQWLNLTLALALLAAPLQAVPGSQMMMKGQHDCLHMSGKDHQPSRGDSAAGHNHMQSGGMKCHNDAAKTTPDRCASDCNDCSACTGTVAALFSPLPVSITPDHTIFNSSPESSRLLYLPSEFRPPRV